nr:ATP synthase F0 subunit 8 [Gonostoma atlanticum]
MPQLNPSPWFLILLFSWATLLTMIPPKTLTYIFPYEPTAISTNTKTEPWNWPWH